MPNRRPPTGVIKTEREIEAIARAGRVVSRAIAIGVRACRPGVTTALVDAAIRAELERDGAVPLFLGYSQDGAPPFPGASCISVNEEVVHGVPGPRRLADGDVVSLDVGARLDGWCADAATTMIVGDEIGDAQGLNPRLLAELRAALDESIESIAPGVRWSAIAERLEARAEAAGLGIVAEYIGHGIGRELHEWPRVPAYRTGFSGDDFVLEPGMVLAIEPIYTARPEGAIRRDRPGHSVRVRLLDDGWTVVTSGGMVAAHEERTIAVCGDGCRVLTPLELAPARCGGITLSPARVGPSV